MICVGQYAMVFRDETLKFGNRTFRVLLYGAYNAMGLIGTENNGIAVLDEDRMQVVLDGHCPQETGAYGPSDDQMVEWRRICRMEDSVFVEFCNSHPMLRDPISLEIKLKRLPSFNAVRFVNIATTPVAYNETAKREFLRVGRQMAIHLAARMGLNEDQYEGRVNKAGIAVSGEVTLHTDTHYIQFSQSWNGKFLVRSCKGRKDYTGGCNHFVNWESLRDLDKVAEFILSLS